MIAGSPLVLPRRRFVSRCAAPLEKSNLDHEALLEDEAPPGLLDDLGLNFRCVKPPHRFKGSHETPVSPDIVRNRIDRLCAATH